ncbi:MAG: CDP-diacylglycerol--glycerol-3-phosphate 3-phosphatidyltransferase [Chroococcopsis gigantea SAG 12.99]|jgi:CDP-diacylglycerol--glycerol-3-phosphate 3-phosphatidyltransferase|nr:CDP-diacylglycerol--glycerol-3-phosphate 3-phosphatidyltransferase [Chlorogloea purpurea SAG 13.99]MDV3001270.1 CDP-diacylglycerol--glycerol-3-phosphate 3-phosphatidyltransferase [Chroococcopsis gigantea SAG 12.99]
MNLPNTITFSRLLGLPLIVYWLQSPEPFYHWLSLGLFLLAAATDWLDGYLARKLNQVTDLGKFLDPLVDKLLVLIPLLVLIQLQRVPAWGVGLILSRELTIAGWRVNPSVTANKGISGANLWGKLKTVTQIMAIGLLIAPLPQGYLLGITIFWLSVALTLLSGLIYLLPPEIPREGEL